jgi:hypothetical protein
MAHGYDRVKNTPSGGDPWDRLSPPPSRLPVRSGDATAQVNEVVDRPGPPTG